jgi:hypothetical protein
LVGHGCEAISSILQIGLGPISVSHE